MLISPIFYKQLLRRYSFAKKLQRQTIIVEKLHKALLYEKDMCKMLMKLIGSFSPTYLRPAITHYLPKA